MRFSIGPMTLIHQRQMKIHINGPKKDFLSAFKQGKLSVVMNLQMPLKDLLLLLKKSFQTIPLITGLTFLLIKATMRRLQLPPVVFFVIVTILMPTIPDTTLFACPRL